MSKFTKVGYALMFALVVAFDGVRMAAASEAPPPRAKPPVWTRDVLDAFFEDAREQLAGERPVKPQAVRLADAGATAAAAADEVGQAFRWSQLVSAETLDAEVKRLVAGLREPLANAGQFKAGGYKQCRADFSVLAVLFGVIAEYDGEVRWKSDAPALRDALARAGRNCKTGTDQTFSESSARRTELEDLVRGERLGGAATEPPEAWSALADRDPLMQRMELALEERISPALANAKQFAKQADAVRQEAELLAMLADIIQREEYEYWDDETFVGHADALLGAAKELTRAAQEANYEPARAAAGRAGQACSVCHEAYRG